MLTYRPETGRNLAEAAVELARDVGDVEIEGHSLVSLGCARVSLGDRGGIDDLETALELVGRRGVVANRAMTNLGWAYDVSGDLLRSHRVTEEAVELAMREGDVQSEWFSRSNLANGWYMLGRWDDALRVVELFAGAPDGVQVASELARGVLARILEARDRVVEAMGETETVLAHMHTVGDVQVTWPTLSFYARLARRLGRQADAEAALDELLGSMAAHESVGDPGVWHSGAVLELIAAGRSRESAKIADRLTPSPWTDVCRAVAERRFLDGADLLAVTGEKPVQAELRLHAARALLAEGRQVEAAEQLEKARAFWSSVGATAYLREADELFAQAS
jgi:tetratricopeptide (TPR) repeat protein